MIDKDLIEYINNTPVEANWFRLELPFKRPEGLYKWRRGTDRLRKIKEFMSSEGYRINIDFKIEPMYYYDKIVVFLSPRIEKYASMIILKWDPK